MQLKEDQESGQDQEARRRILEEKHLSAPTDPSELREVLRDHGFGRNLVDKLCIRGIEAEYLCRPDLLGMREGRQVPGYFGWPHRRWQEFFLRLVQNAGFRRDLLASDMVFAPGRDLTKLSTAAGAALEEYLELEFARYLATKAVSFSVLDEFFTRNDGVFYSYLAQRIGPKLYETDTGSFIVPDLDGEDLIVMARAELDIHVDDVLKQHRGWKGVRNNTPIGGQGKRFSFNSLKSPRDGMETATVRAHFGKTGFLGNIGAFIQLLRTFGMQSVQWITTPPDAYCWRNSYGKPCTVYSYSHEGGGNLYYRYLSDELRLQGSDGYGLTFVAFKELSS